MSIVLGIEGKRAFVTGGSKGIGAAIVRALSAAGADVVFSARDEKSAAVIAKETGATPEIFDLLDTEATQCALEKHLAIDILVNNAGMDQHAVFTKTTPEDWAYLLNINLIAVFATTHAVLPTMQERGYGRVINISSEAGRLGSYGGSVYAAAKGGLHAFTKSIARENGRKCITANIIAPGPVDTPLLRSAVEQGGDKMLDIMKKATVVNRLGTPEEVAAAVLYLASEQAGFVTGEILGVSGGMGMG